MKKQIMEADSRMVQLVHLGACALDILAVGIYYMWRQTALGRFCADLSLHLTVWINVLPFLPVSLVINLRVLKLQTEPAEKKRWLVYTLLSPVVYVISSTIAGCIWLAVTGGV